MCSECVQISVHDLLCSGRNVQSKMYMSWCARDMYRVKCTRDVVYTTPPAITEGAGEEVALVMGGRGSNGRKGGHGPLQRPLLLLQPLLLLLLLLFLHFLLLTTPATPYIVPYHFFSPFLFLLFYLITHPLTPYCASSSWPLILLLLLVPPCWSSFSLSFLTLSCIYSRFFSYIFQNDSHSTSILIPDQFFTPNPKNNHSLSISKPVISYLYLKQAMIVRNVHRTRRASTIINYNE